MRKRLFMFAGCGLLAAAVAGVFMAEPRELQALSMDPPRFENLDRLIPGYPQSQFFPMGPDVRVDGVSREMAYAVTQDSPTQVADRYDAVFRSQGYRVVRREADGQAYVGASFPSDPWVRSVLATEDGERTTIVASVTQSGAEPQDSTLPEIFNCEIDHTTSAKDSDVWTEIGLLRCSGELRDVLERFDEKLGGNANESIDEAGAVFRRYEGTERRAVLTATQVSLDPAVVMVNLTWQQR